jgi:uncharacterized protein (DUF924 family)
MEIASFEDVLAFWFSEAQSSRWYANDDKFDAEIRQRFLSTYEAAQHRSMPRGETLHVLALSS